MGLLGKLRGSGDGDGNDFGGEDNRRFSAIKAEQWKTMSEGTRRSLKTTDKVLLKAAEEAERAGDMKRAQELRRSIGD
jgi:hypothetical protein